MPYKKDDVAPLITSTSEELLERRAITNVFVYKNWNAGDGDIQCGGKEVRSMKNYAMRKSERGTSPAISV